VDVNYEVHTLNGQTEYSGPERNHQVRDYEQGLASVENVLKD
jgi:hypothetical protein